MGKYIILINSNGKFDYCHVVQSGGFSKGFKRIACLGNVNTLKEINPNFLEILKEKIEDFQSIEDRK
uniref:hypothetical protein n=2 Tax=Mycoplasmopsis primatum TaxID=55604 RepID=UPI000568BE99